MIAPGLGEMVYKDHPRRLTLPTQSYHHLRRDMTGTYEIITGVYDRDVTIGLFNQQIRSSRRGSDLRVMKHSFFFRVTDSLISLPNQVIEAPIVEAFERRLDRH